MKQENLLKLIELKTKLNSIEYYKGDPGEKGDPGYTPKKGVDYMTEQEREEFTRDILGILVPAITSELESKYEDNFSTEKIDKIKEDVLSRIKIDPVSIDYDNIISTVLNRIGESSEDDEDIDFGAFGEKIKKEILQTITAEYTRDLLETLEGDNRIDKSAIKGLEEIVDRDTMDRAISILDQRTQFLINKQTVSTSDPGGSSTLANIATNSTTSGASLYTMTSTIPVEFRRSGGATLLYLDETNGRVGIRTSTPSTAFEVSGGTATNVIRSTNTDNNGGTSWANVIAHDVQFYNSDPSAPGIYAAIRAVGNVASSSGGAASYDLTFSTGGYLSALSEKMRIMTNGNVGINTTSASSRLDILDTSSAQLRLTYTAGTVFSTFTTNSTGQLNIVTTATSKFKIDGITVGRANNSNANMAVGFQALDTISTGVNSNAFGQNALQNCNSNSNDAFGYFALQALTSGAFNTAFGSFALGSSVSNNSNAAFGYLALVSITSGDENLAFGNQAGRYFGAGSSALTSASQSLFLGPTTRASANGNSNEVVIGYNTIGNGSNSVTLGNTSITTTVLRGSVGLQTTAPTHTLTLGSTSTGIAYYNTADQTTNFERLLVSWSTNIAQIYVGSGGSGTLRQMRVGAANTYFQSDTNAGGSSYKASIVHTASTSANGFQWSQSGGFTASSGSQIGFGINQTVNQTSTAGFTDLLVNRTQTAVGSGNQRLIDLQVGGTSQFHVDNTGSTVVGALAALTTTATTGFLYIPTSAGAPTGVPVAKTGKVAMQFDTTNNRLYVYNGAWISVVLA